MRKDFCPHYFLLRWDHLVAIVEFVLFSPHLLQCICRAQESSLFQHLIFLLIINTLLHYGCIAPTLRYCIRNCCMSTPQLQALAVALIFKLLQSTSLPSTLLFFFLFFFSFLSVVTQVPALLGLANALVPGQFFKGSRLKSAARQPRISVFIRCQNARSHFDELRNTSRNRNQAAVVVESVRDVLFGLRDTSFMWGALSLSSVLTRAEVATRKQQTRFLLSLVQFVCEHVCCNRPSFLDSVRLSVAFCYKKGGRRFVYIELSLCARNRFLSEGARSVFRRG